MKGLLSAVLAAGSFVLALDAFAQSSTSAPAASPSPAVQTNPAPAAPVSPSKRFACLTAAQGLTGQERQDQIQLCVAQARLDCLKQAIDQKVVGPQRREFVKNCMRD